MNININVLIDHRLIEALKGWDALIWVGVITVVFIIAVTIIICCYLSNNKHSISEIKKTVKLYKREQRAAR